MFSEIDKRETIFSLDNFYDEVLEKLKAYQTYYEFGKDSFMKATKDFVEKDGVYYLPDYIIYKNLNLNTSQIENVSQKLNSLYYQFKNLKKSHFVGYFIYFEKNILENESEITYITKEGFAFLFLGENFNAKPQEIQQIFYLYEIARWKQDVVKDLLVIGELFTLKFKADLKNYEINNETYKDLKNILDSMLNEALGAVRESLANRKPKKCYTYCCIDSKKKVAKVGFSENPDKRIKSLLIKTAPIVLEFETKSQAILKEREIHLELEGHRFLNEYFHLNDDSLKILKRHFESIELEKIENE